ncbi:MAG: histone methyltransferase set2 [Thelocarpon superellum]|nr:MAG: histone methyltransferase set2 [Thelocarpon superellum]
MPTHADEEKPIVGDPSAGGMQTEDGLASDEEMRNPEPDQVGVKEEELAAPPSRSSPPPSPPPLSNGVKAMSISPSKTERSPSPSPASIQNGIETKRGGELAVKLEPGKAPKLSRTASQKFVARPPPLFDHLPDATEAATSSFEVIPDCIYANRHMGSSDQEALGCECAEEWDGTRNGACGDDSDCINRLTKIECTDKECGCGSGCQNQRFQLRQFARVSVIRTEKKGYGLRADTDLNAHEFIFEYIGDVIDERNFRKRMVQYDEEGIKHFYFMSLQKNVFVDATKRGNLGRFCNHSCNPNCYVDKWVVGDKLRMGIFTERKIQAGEELVFNYNVDRYGADPQPCYCGEPNCTGFLGGKTQTERATKLSALVQEALGIDDLDDWDTAVAKKPRKKKAGENDEEYVDRVQPKSLDESSVTKVVATLMQCQDKEKWIVVKLLSRVQRCGNDRVWHRVVQMHGYQAMRSALTAWKEDVNIVLQILDILDKFPRLTRNKISDAKIEPIVESLITCEDERVKQGATLLLQEWSTLEVAYRIPRKKRDANTSHPPERPDRFERRESDREERKERSRSSSPSLDGRGSSAPTGPRRNFPSRSSSHANASRPPFPRRPFNPLPNGWFAAMSNGKAYYYSASGQTTWTRPTVPAIQPPPPPKAPSSEQTLQQIIDSITKEKPKETAAAVATPEPVVDQAKAKKEGQEKWRGYSEDKKKKLYENTLFPHVKYVTDKFKTKLPKDDLKRFAKEIAKKLVNSDFKNQRVDDPTQISSRQEKHVKKYVKDFFDKAVAKKRTHDMKKAARKDQEKTKDGDSADSPPSPAKAADDDETETPELEADRTMELSDDDADLKDAAASNPPTPGDLGSNGDTLKRKRTGQADAAETMTPTDATDDDGSPSKRMKPTTPPPPPPPPPPPATDMEVDMDGETCDADTTSPGQTQDMESTPLADARTALTNGETGTLENGTLQHRSQNDSPTAPRDDDKTRPDKMRKPPSPSPSSTAAHLFQGMNPERLRQLDV